MSIYGNLKPSKRARRRDRLGLSSRHTRLVTAIACLILTAESAYSEPLDAQSLIQRPPSDHHPELKAIRLDSVINSIWPRNHLQGLYDRHGLAHCDSSRAGLGAVVDHDAWMKFSCRHTSRLPQSSTHSPGAADTAELSNGIDSNLIQAGIQHFGSQASPFVKALISGKIDFSFNLLGKKTSNGSSQGEILPERYVVQYEPIPHEQKTNDNDVDRKRVASLGNGQSPGGLADELVRASAAEAAKPRFDTAIRFKKRLVARPAEPITTSESAEEIVTTADQISDFLHSIGLPEGSFERLQGRLERNAGEGNLLAQTKLIIEEGSRALVFAEALPFKGDVAYGFSIPISRHDFGRVRYGMDGQPTTYRYEHHRAGSRLSLEFEDINSSVKFEAVIPL